jgi:BirA family transcriptional regulator, biotin operon repressor / biotin---[acetyl-CoA-carboxylase] ligase
MMPLPGWEALDRAGWARAMGVPHLELHQVLDSTNDRVRALGAAGSAPFTTVVAHAQRAGRGREGRPWVSGPGAGLWISVLLPPPLGGPPGVAPLAVGVALAEALESLGVTGVGLKWPNDVLLELPAGAGKVAGILCEVVSTAQGSSIVAGVGVNLLPPGRGMTGPAAGLVPEVKGAAGVRLAAGVLATEFVRSLRRRADPPPDRLTGELRRAWERRDALVGRRIVMTPGPRGVARGVGDDGALLVETVPGRAPEKVRAGSVRLEAPELPEGGTEADAANPAREEV